MTNDDFFSTPDEIPDRPQRAKPRSLDREPAEPWLVEEPKKTHVNPAKVKFGVKSAVRIITPFIILAGVAILGYYLYSIFSGAYGG